jgi:cell division septal protein FtsQ
MPRTETRILWICIFLALLAFGGALIYRSAERSGRFDLDTVRISGIRQVDSAAVCEVVAPYFGQSLGSIDRERLVDDLEGLPGVETAYVSLLWPTTVRVRAGLARPVLVLRDEGGARPVSEICEYLPSTFMSDTLPVVLLVGIPDSTAVAEVIDWLSDGTSVSWEGNLVLNQGTLSILLDGNRSVILGGGDLSEKWNTYRAVRDCALLEGNWLEMDLRYSNQAILRFRE